MPINTVANNGTSVDVATMPMSSKTDSDNNNTSLSDNIKIPTPPAVPPPLPSPKNVAISFSNTDEKISASNIKESVNAPKDVETLERLSSERASADDDDDEDKLTIHDAGNVNLDILDVNDINNPVTLNDEVLIPDIEVI